MHPTTALRQPLGINMISRHLQAHRLPTIPMCGSFQKLLQTDADKSLVGSGEGSEDCRL